MKVSRRASHFGRTGRAKAAHGAVNRGRRSQTSENMGRRASAAHWRFTPPPTDPEAQAEKGSS